MYTNWVCLFLSNKASPSFLHAYHLGFPTLTPSPPQLQATTVTQQSLWKPLFKEATPGSSHVPFKWNLQRPAHGQSPEETTFYLFYLRKKFKNLACKKKSDPNPHFLPLNLSPCLLPSINFFKKATDVVKPSQQSLGQIRKPRQRPDLRPKIWSASQRGQAMK